MKTGTHYVMQFQGNSGNWLDDAVCETMDEAMKYYNKSQAFNRRIILRFLCEAILEQSITRPLIK